jgi:membrane-associated phospholipid phosphatase
MRANADMERVRPTRIFWIVAAMAALLAAAGLLGLDGPVARWSEGVQPGEVVLSQLTTLLDLLLLKPVSNFLLGLLLIVLALVLLLVRRTRRGGWLLLYVGAVQFSATVVADLAKPQFGRLRPREAMVEGGRVDTWFVGANAFPSGHTAFYAGLFFALIAVLPRAALLWLIPPSIIAVTRIVEHDHYLSDVFVSIALAALLAIAFRFLVRRATASPAIRS